MSPRRAGQYRGADRGRGNASSAAVSCTRSPGTRSSKKRVLAALVVFVRSISGSIIDSACTSPHSSYHLLDGGLPPMPADATRRTRRAFWIVAAIVILVALAVPAAIVSGYRPQPDVRNFGTVQNGRHAGVVCGGIRPRNAAKRRVSTSPGVPEPSGPTSRITLRSWTPSHTVPGLARSSCCSANARRPAAGGLSCAAGLPRSR